MEDAAMFTVIRAAHVKYADTDGFLTAQDCLLAVADLTSAFPDIAEALGDVAQEMDRPVHVEDVMMTVGCLCENR
jgi:hypothetical protein